MLFLVVIGQSSGIAVLQNVHVVEAPDAKAAKKIAAEREPTTDVYNCRPIPLESVRDGWRFFT